MKLVKLAVERFQCIEAAEVEFGPGLNVLYGPNDLGKSSLAWAIRAVLLLQHTSTHHERFVSWYGDGTPRVALTFTDASGRYWRVTKTFAGSAGRSSLETSKDGRTFTPDGTARQVDEKLRNLLGWGLQSPGGSGGKRGFPDSFLAQVLLSEQDSVRKVLFDSSLEGDADESGRKRLVEALGALAQDPLFKKVLDTAQAQVDRAFTPTGRQRRTAGSPFLAVTERIKELTRERDELEAKVRETKLAETRIRELVDRRDGTAREHATAAERLAELQAQLAVSRRRAALRAQLDAEAAKLREVDELRRALETTHGEIARAADRIALGATRLAQLADQVAARTAARDAARQDLDALALDERATVEQRQLAERQQALQEAHHDATRATDRATAAKRAALAASERVHAARAALPSLAATARVADAALAHATTAEQQAQQHLGSARDRLRDATSSDHARARELRRSELENRRLVAVADRDHVRARVQAATEVEGLVGRAAEARRGCAALAASLDATRAASVDAERQLAVVDAELAALQQVERLAQLRAAQGSLAAADAALARAAAARAQAAAKRAEAAALRASVRDDLPDAAEVGELRRLHDDLRVAEARLGGGLSITIRPRRELALTATRDGAAEAPRRTAEPVTLSADRSLSLAIAELVDIDITAGEPAARAHAAELRARWAREGEPRLRALGLDALDALAAAVAHREEVRHAADALDRDADTAELRAGQSLDVDRDALAARVADLERALADEDVAALGARLDGLGPDWERARARAHAAAMARRAELVTQLDAARVRVTRTETQLEAETAAAVALETTARAREAELGGSPAEIAAAARAQLAAVDADLHALEHQLAALATEATDDAKLRDVVARCEQAVTEATQMREAARAEAARARDALVQGQAHLDGACRQAADADTAGVWRAALADGTPLPLVHWNQQLADAEARQQAVAAERAELQRRVEDLAREREQAIAHARTALQTAEAAVHAATTALDQARTAHDEVKAEHTNQRLAAAELETRLASTSAEATRAAIATLQAELAAIARGPDVEAGQVEAAEARVRSLADRLRDDEAELERARGALEQIGGAIVLERQRELDEALAREQRREHEIEVEYGAWKLLVETLRATEITQGAHLGRALAGPVSERFRALTGGRYGRLELGAHLDAQGLEVAGAPRDIHALSAGTQDQLATLLRLCIAEQLASTIVLDDHLSQSDPKRITWFNSILRAAAHQIQIVLITCRPLEVLAEGELPAAPERTKSSAAGTVRAIDLTRVIRRFAPDAEQRTPPLEAPSSPAPRARSRTDRTS